jgi:anti-sigma factor RsiW
MDINIDIDIDLDWNWDIGCQRFAVLMVLAADKELTPPQRQSMEAHAAFCAACRERLAAFQRVDAHLKATGELLDAANPARPATRIEMRRQLALVTRQRRRPPVWQWAAAAVVLLALAAALVWRPAAHQPPVAKFNLEWHADGMEVFRVELPLAPGCAPFLDDSQGETRVLADVVVGPDGAPRSVRLAN